MTSRMRTFWDHVRAALREECGQELGQRDRDRFKKRRELSDQLGLDHKTLKSFLNGNQIGLGADALGRLFQSRPNLHRTYTEMMEPQSLRKIRPESRPELQLKFPFGS